MNRLRWQLSMAKQQLGWLGLIGVVVLTFVATYFFAVFLHTQQLLEDAQQALLTVKTKQTADNAIHVSTVIDNPAEQLQIFTGNFPATESVNKTWEELAKLAEKSGLTIDHAHYESSPEKHAGLLRYQLNMPVKATYPQILDFLAEVIQSTPNVALEQLSFRRESVDSNLIDANIDLALYVRTP